MSNLEGDLIPSGAEQKVGLPPGSVVFVGEERTEPVECRVLEYEPDHLMETTEERVEEVLKYRDTTLVTWINVAGVHEDLTMPGAIRRRCGGALPSQRRKAGRPRRFEGDPRCAT